MGSSKTPSTQKGPKKDTKTPKGKVKKQRKKARDEALANAAKKASEN